MSTKKSFTELADRSRQALKPTVPAINHQALWFEAGRVSVRSARVSGLALMAYSTVMTATAASLALALALPRAEQPESTLAPTQIVEAPAGPVESSPQVAAETTTDTPDLWRALLPSRPVDPDSYLARRARALGGDLDALSPRSLVIWEPGAESPTEPSPPATRKRLLEEYLPDLPPAKPPRPRSGSTRRESDLKNKELA